MFLLAQINTHESIHNLMVIQPENWLMAYADFKIIDNAVLVPMKFLHPVRGFQVTLIWSGDFIKMERQIIPV